METRESKLHYVCVDEIEFVARLIHRSQHCRSIYTVMHMCSVQTSATCHLRHGGANDKLIR